MSQTNTWQMVKQHGPIPAIEEVNLSENLWLNYPSQGQEEKEIVCRYKLTYA